MKILITGCKGMLGTDLMQILSADHHMIGLTKDQLDITNLEETIQIVKEISPHMIINCAAYTNVDGCETEIDLAYKVNAIGPRNLAIAGQEISAGLVHISSDYVFDGAGKQAYIEGDYANPFNIYGRSKLEGENYIKSFSNKYFIIRTQWLYGVHGRNFVKTILNLSQEQKELKVVNDQFGCPTFSIDLCNTIKDLIVTKEYGVYHVSNEGITSWFQFAKDILEVAGIQNVTVNPCTTQEFPRPAKRPAYSPLKNYNLALCGFRPLRHYKSALEDYMRVLAKFTNS